MLQTSLLSDISQVFSSDYFGRSLSGGLRNLRRIEYPLRMNTNKRTISSITKSATIRPNSVVIIPNKEVDIFFIPFILDSFYVRHGILNGKASVRSLASLSIVTIPDEEKEYYCKLERMLLGISIIGEERIGYEYFYTAERLFSDIREAIVFELYERDFMHKENIHVAEYWIKERMALLDNNIEPFEELVSLVNSILKPGNVLYDNLKRFYLLIQRNRQ